jgi:hypothetical protein
LGSHGQYLPLFFPCPAGTELRAHWPDFESGVGTTRVALETGWSDVKRSSFSEESNTITRVRYRRGIGVARPALLPNCCQLRPISECCEMRTLKYRRSRPQSDAETDPEFNVSVKGFVEAHDGPRQSIALRSHGERGQHTLQNVEARPASVCSLRSRAPQEQANPASAQPS